MKHPWEWAIAAGALLGALGWWLPWVLSESGAAALVLLGLDLGDFWKFTAEWRGGLFELERVLFFLPPTLAAMILALWLAGQCGWWRWFLLPLLLFLSVVILPAFEFVRPALAGVPFLYEYEALEGPAQDVMASYAREFTFQLQLAFAAVLVVLLVPLWQRLSDQVRRSLIALLAITGAILPPWALWRTWLVLDSFYGGGALLGPGAVVSSGGFTLATVGALISLLVSHAPDRAHAAG
ncbi:MAG: hypothetical protein M3220_17240 [Chloroflexota bacterium]|nr:hypothetical protein [Chloroflexota bacterium]